MLKLSSPGPARHRLGYIAILALALTASALVYAAQPLHRNGAITYRATPQSVDEALVLFNGMQGAVLDYAQHHAMRLPADSAAAQLPPANLITGKYVLQAAVRHGVVTAALRDPANRSKAAGHVLSVPHVNQAGKTLNWTCQSPDIPAIGELTAGCVYVPPATRAVAVASAPVYQLAMSLTRGAKVLATPVVCVKAGQPAAIEQSTASGARVWHFDLKLDPVADGQVQVRIDGSIGAPDGSVVTLHPRLRGEWGKAMSTSVTPVAGGQPFTVSVMPAMGCPPSGA